MFFLHVFLCTTCVPGACRSRNGHQIPRNWSHEMLQAIMWAPGIKPRSLEEQPVLLTTETRGSVGQGYPDADTKLLSRMPDHQPLGHPASTPTWKETFERPRRGAGGWNRDGQWVAVALALQRPSGMVLDCLPTMPCGRVFSGKTRASAGPAVLP